MVPALIAALLAIPAPSTTNPVAQLADAHASRRVARRITPVEIRTPGVKEAVLRADGAETTVYVGQPGERIELVLKGPGKLVLTIHQLLDLESPSKKLTFTVRMDGRAKKKVKVAASPLDGGSLDGDLLPSTGKRHTRRIKRGKHTVEVLIPEDGRGAALVIDYRPKRAREPAPVVLGGEEPGPEPSGDLMAVAADILADEVEVPAEEVEAAPVEPAGPETLADRVERRVQAGEIRDGLLDTYPTMTVVNTNRDERHELHRVGEEQLFGFMVAGPGVVTVRLYRLIGAAETAADGASYSVTILENDVLLQKLGGTTKLSETWRVESGVGVSLAEPKEYQLTVGPKKSQLGFQILGAPQGMAIRYSFTAEEASLAAVALSMDEVDLSAAVESQPTVVMEVDITETVVRVEDEESVVGLALQVGTIISVVGGEPALAAGLELDVVLPFADRLIEVGLQGSYQRHAIKVSVGNVDPTSVDAESTITSVPVLGKIVVRIPLGDVLLGTEAGLFLHGGGGICYVRAVRSALNADETSSSITWAVRGGAGTEVALGPGWLAVEAGYLFVPPSDFANSLRNYTPGGVAVAAQYRFDF